MFPHSRIVRRVEQIVYFLRDGNSHQCVTSATMYKTRQAMKGEFNIEALSCNHICSGKVINITQPVCVFIALSIQHAMRMRLIVICSMSHSSKFIHIIS